MSKQFIQISSKYRTNQNDDTHDCKIELPQIMREGHYKLVYALIPNSIYNVNINNNKLVFTDNARHEIYLNVGIYNEESLIDHLVEEMNIASNGYNTYTITYVETTNKLNFSAVNNFQFHFSESTCHELLGFKYNDTPSNVTIVSDNMINLSPFHTINISIDQISSISQKVNQGTSLIIPLPNNVLSYYNFMPYQSFQQILHIERDKRIIKIDIRDELNNLLDLNGIDWCLILEKL